MGFFSSIKDEVKKRREFNQKEKALEREAYEQQRLSLAPKFGEARAKQEYKDRLSGKARFTGGKAILDQIGGAGSLMGPPPKKGKGRNNNFPF